LSNVIAAVKHSYQNYELHPQKQHTRIYQEPNPSNVKVLHQHEQLQPTICTIPNPPVIHPLPEPKTGTMNATARLLLKSGNFATPYIDTVRVHVDGGANRSITNSTSNLLSYRNIKKYPMSGVAAGEAALVFTGVGYLLWQSNTGDVVLVKCYYSSEAADTIISPTDIVVNNISNYNAWSQYSNVDTGTGYITLHCRGDSAPLTFDLTSSNGLWYHNNPHNTTDYHTWSKSQGAGHPTIHRLNRAAEYSLAHLRYGCAGQRSLSMVHHDVDNQPKLQLHCFFKCLACMLATGDSRDKKNTKDNKTNVEFDDWFD
jgi:hypothetical protein